MAASTPRRTLRACVAIVAGTAIFGASASASADVEPFRSQRYAPSSNGYSSIAFDTQSGKLSHFFEHPYRFPAAGVESRNFAYDAYPGVRVGGVGTWLSSIAPTSVEYQPGTGIVHVVRSMAAQGLTFDEYHFTPMGLAEHAALMLLKVTRTSGTGAVDAYALYNFHLGAGSPSPGTAGEQSSYEASRDAFYEYGPAGLTFAYGSVGASTKHASSPASPYAALLAGSDLANNSGTSAPTDDVAIGFQTSLGSPASGSSAWAGWFVTTGLDSNAGPVVDRVRAWIAGRSPEQLLADEQTAWDKWRAPAPKGATELEASVFASAQAVLRMGQISAADKSDGQILASIAPGQWNIAWVRDMAYAVVALARTGHVEEAKRAIRFQLAATANQYQTYVGKPYAISVVRYFGNGTEESDSNQDGPNIEFDGFGLFLWELTETIRAANDPSFVSEVLPRVQSEVADVLVALQEPATGLIGRDSSIWEVHWNGKQEHFTYTTITAAKGLCSLASVLDGTGDSKSAALYRGAGKKAVDAIMTYLRAPNGALVQSVEALARGSAFLDAAAVEAMNLGLVHPKGRTARATLDALQGALVPPSGRGLFRNQTGGWYDSQEWVFVDLRTSHALDAAGDSQAASLLQWNVGQAAENFGLFAELHDRVTAEYRGEVPMVGFGSGAYTLALLDRGSAIEASCGELADAPVDGTNPDGGVIAPGDGGSGADNDGGIVTGGSPNGDSGGDSGCAIGMRRAAPSGLGARSVSVSLILAVAAGLRWRRRRSRSRATAPAQDRSTRRP